jgi:protein TonB
MAEPRRPLYSALGISVTCHAVFLLVILFLASFPPEQVDTRTPPIPTELVFLQESGPGGGGGGTSVPAAPAKIEIPPPQPAVTLTATPPPVADPPPPSLDAPVQTNNATVLMGGGSNPMAATGPGGNGPGRGLGDGNGPGLLDGKDGGTGGGPKQPGALTTQPYPIRSVKPDYTSQALQARLQGSVTLEVEVLANGTVGAVKVLKSLDTRYGLDGQAIRCAKQWVFRPGTINGKPVDSLVQIILEFGLR